MNKETAILEAIRLGIITVDAESGDVHCCKTSQGSRRDPRLVTHRTHAGYVQGSFRLNRFGKRWYFRAHRAVWLSVHGAIPSDLTIDHINRDRSDNRICNLRLATELEQKHNRDTAFGERNGQSVLTASQVIEARRLKREHGIGAPSLALMFGCSTGCITKVLSKKTWAFVANE